jgi:hypothetical protein
VIDPRLAAQVPEDASAVVGLNLTVLRASPLYARLPHPFGDAPYVLIAVRGQELLTITPDGHASASRHAPSPLLALAEPLAAKNPVWAVIRGGTALPLEGNLANLNNLLRDVETVTLVAQPGDRLAVDLVASCATPDAARIFEGHFRAVLVLTRTASLVQVQREDRMVRASLSVSPELLR